ncbi:MAG: hypothetical protein QOC89_2810 [Paraburkholderia sp.]|nr:hypothetical protein [Paraburkholderia sp.]
MKCLDCGTCRERDGNTAPTRPGEIRETGSIGHNDEILMVPDTLADARFHDNPLVTDSPNIRFYAGCPLTVPIGSKLGTLCLIDTKPRGLDEEERELLRDLAHIVATRSAIASARFSTIPRGMHRSPTCSRLPMRRCIATSRRRRPGPRAATERGMNASVSGTHTRRAADSGDEKIHSIRPYGLSTSQESAPARRRIALVRHARHNSALPPPVTARIL